MNRGTVWISLALLLLVTAVAYRPVLDNGLVWDDWTNIAPPDAPFTAPLMELLERAFTDVRLGHWQPLAWLSLAVDRLVWGPNASGFHLTNVLIHLLNVVLFAGVGWQLFETTRTRSPLSPPGWPAVAALASAATFAVHPLRVETVAWLTERRHLLSAAFFLSAALCWLIALDRGQRPRPRLGWAAAAFASYALSLLSTPLGIALPVVLLVLDVWPLGRWRADSGWRGASRLLVEKMPFLALAALFSLTALAAQHVDDALVPTDRYGVSQRLAQAAYGATFYPRALFATHWSPLYERPAGLDPLEPRFVLAVVGVVAITVGLALGRRRAPALLAAWLAYLALLAPVSGLAQAGIQLVADRYSYLAGLPFALLIGLAVATVTTDRRALAASLITGLSFAAVLGWWALRTHDQAKVWRDDRALWSHVIRLGPSAHAHAHLAGIALQGGELGPALEHAIRAVEIAPRYGRTWHAMISVLERRGIDQEGERLREAARLLEAHLPAQGGHPLAWYAVGLARAAGGDRANAIPAFESAVAGDPTLVSAWRALVVTTAASKPSEARAAVARGLEAVPGDPVLTDFKRRLDAAAPPPPPP